MTPKRAHYSLIQFCPDPARLESVNVGAVLVCPDLDYVDVQIDRSNDRIRRVFPDLRHDPGYLTTAKKAIRNRIVDFKSDFLNMEELQRYIHTRANDFILTPARPIRVSDPAATLIDLFTDLVVGHRVSVEATPLLPQLDRKLRAPGLVERIRFDEHIQVPLIEKNIIAPYAYQNGTLNLVLPLALEPSTRGVNTAARTAVESDLIQRHLRMHVTVVLQVGSGTKMAETGIRATRVFDEYKIAAYPSYEIEKLVERIEKEAKPA